MQWESHIVPPLPEKKSNFFEIRAAKGLPGDWGTPQRVLLFSGRSKGSLLAKMVQMPSALAVLTVILGLERDFDNRFCVQLSILESRTDRLRVRKSADFSPFQVVLSISTIK